MPPVNLFHLSPPKLLCLPERICLSVSGLLHLMSSRLIQVSTSDRIFFFFFSDNGLSARSSGMHLQSQHFGSRGRWIPVNWRPSNSTKWFHGQPELNSETMSQKERVGASHSRSRPQTYHVAEDDFKLDRLPPPPTQCWGQGLHALPRRALYQLGHAPSPSCHCFMSLESPSPSKQCLCKE